MQTPSLRLIADRDQAVEVVSLPPRWRVEAEFRARHGKYRGAWWGGLGAEYPDRLADEAAARAVAAQVPCFAVRGHARRVNRSYDRETARESRGRLS
ncbi:MAG: hypothetical protein K6U14_07985 [Firmicutes bacterium]|nr:hypothetical protein [Alicyclobacillaceae bacterium]MCL6497554.1 hypothetical protein [Bacillota bacterium]